jgi:acyl-CoA dehydrogenase
MRLIGVAERALEMMCQQAKARVAFGERLFEQGVTLERIAESRILIDQARWLVLNAAYAMGTAGNRGAKQEIAMVKVAAPSMACKIIDWAVQMLSGGGVCDDFPLAVAYASARSLRFAACPDEVHREQIGKLELAKVRRALQERENASGDAGDGS